MPAAKATTAPPPTKPQPVVLDRYLTLREVKVCTGLRGTTTIYVRMKAGTFPQSIPLGGRMVRWSAAEIAQWMEERKAERATAAETAA